MTTRTGADICRDLLAPSASVRAALAVQAYCELLADLEQAAQEEPPGRAALANLRDRFRMLDAAYLGRSIEDLAPLTERVAAALTCAVMASVATERARRLAMRLEHSAARRRLLAMLEHDADDLELDELVDLAARMVSRLK